MDIKGDNLISISLLRTLMTDIVVGLTEQGYSKIGGGDIFKIVEKNGRRIEIYPDIDDNIIVRYSEIKEEG